MITNRSLYGLCLGKLAICLFAIFRRTAPQTSAKIDNIITEDSAVTTMKTITNCYLAFILWGGQWHTRPNLAEVRSRPDEKLGLYYYYYDISRV